MSYIDTIDDRIKEYFSILEPNYPVWLNDYINTKELLKQKYISVTNGTIYSDLFENNFFFKFRPFSCSSSYSLAFYT